MNKRIVHYDDSKPVQEVGERVILHPINHPDTINVSNTTTVITSKVVSWNKETGVIETQNTVYIPMGAKQ